MSAAHAGIGELEFDLEALRRKYREERDKRHRDEGIEQYVEVKGDFSHYIDDPYADADFKRHLRTAVTEVSRTKRPRSAW